MARMLGWWLPPRVAQMELATALITHQREAPPYCLPCHSGADQWNRQSSRFVLNLQSAPLWAAHAHSGERKKKSHIVVLSSSFVPCLPCVAILFFSVFIAVNMRRVCERLHISFVFYESAIQNVLLTAIKPSVTANQISNWLYYSLSCALKMKVCFLWHQLWRPEQLSGNTKIIGETSMAVC